VLGFGYGFPYYYGYPDLGYGALASDYAYPDYGYPDYGYDNAAADVSPDPDTQVDLYANQNAQGYYDVGYQWGGELKQNRLSVDQLAAYLKTYILAASPPQQSAFRAGFVASAAADAAAVFDQAMQEAGRRN